MCHNLEYTAAILSPWLRHDLRLARAVLYHTLLMTTCVSPGAAHMQYSLWQHGKGKVRSHALHSQHGMWMDAQSAYHTLVFSL